MEYGAIDLHTQDSQIRIVREDGTVVLDRRIRTRTDRFAAVFGDHAPMRILLETGTESEWVAQCLEGLGHTVVVADPNYAAMYGARVRRIKTDRRDVAALADANRRGVYRAAHRASATALQLRRQLQVRAHLVTMRTELINLVRAQVRAAGYRVPSGGADAFGARIARLAMPAPLERTLAPALAALAALQPLIATEDRQARATAAADPLATRLQTAPGIGPITALLFRATVDDVRRFAGPGPLTSYLGLVPRERSSGTQQRQGGITKTGPGQLRALLVQSAWTIWRLPGSSPRLHDWVHRLAARRGRAVAIVGLARRLARILYAMWRDGRPFVAARLHDRVAA
jgi:transposase